MDAAVQVLIAIMACVLFGCCIVTVKAKSKYTRSLVRLYLCAVLTMFAYSLFLFCGTREPALFFNGVYFACTDWLVICMLLFCADYTNIYKKRKYDSIILYGIAALDTAALLLNYIWRFMFDADIGVDASGEEYFISIFKFPHYLHLAFCYVIVFFAFTILLYGIIKSPELYGKTYVSMLVPFLCIVICNFICYSMNLQVDLSVLLYAVLAAVICYLSVLASPKKLLSRMLMKVNGEMTDAIICKDIYGNIVYANHTAESIFFDKNNRHMGKNRTVMKSKFDGNRSDAAGDLKDNDVKHNIVTMFIDGLERFFAVEFINLTDNGGRIGLLVKMTDKTSEIKAYEEDRIRAEHDSLTGIYNRESFFREAEKVMKNDADTPRYMIASDIKDFKMINELFGEKTGDEILKKQAMLIKKMSHRGNVYGRIADNSFALFMPCKYYSEEKMLRAMKSMQSFTDASIYKMHIYVGVYKVTDTSESVQVMYDKARMTIEAMKGDYQRIFMHYDDRMMKQMVYENNILSEFGDAVSEGRFELYLQPQVDREKNIVGAEAFPCWAHPARGLMMPDEFYPILEKTGHAHLLDVIIWRKAVKNLAEWQRMGREDMYMAISISSKDFYYLNIYGVLTECVEEYGVNPGNIKIEITETALMSNLNKFMDLSVSFQEYGFEIEIDNFGHGYSSLNMLKDINANYLKLDTDIPDSCFGKNPDARSRIIFNSIIKMAGKLGMKVVIDGVSNEGQAEYAREAGCAYFQGDYYYKMLSAREFNDKYIGSGQK